MEQQIGVAAYRHSQQGTGELAALRVEFPCTLANPVTDAGEQKMPYFG